MSTKSIYELEARAISGEKVSLGQFKDKVLLVVNVASQCGFTPQYEGLEHLYRKYKDQGFEVLGFPCNQFGLQEPGTEEQIKNFCESHFGVTFPMFAKVSVNGPETHPIYEFLKSEKKGILGTEAIKWNFTKFLVDRNGQVVRRYAPNDAPEKISGEIEKELG